MANQGTPAFTGLALHQDAKWRFTFYRKAVAAKPEPKPQAEKAKKGKK